MAHRGKKPIKLIVRDPVSSRSCSGWLHPRGYMGASQTHLDIECRGGLLADLARFHARVECIDEGGCVTLRYSELEVRLCPIEGCRELKCLGGRAYVMTTRRGLVYVGGVSCLDA